MGSIKGLRLLLDTHIILWSLADPAKLSREVAKELESESNELWYSPISVWEIMLLAEKGQIAVGSDIEASVRDMFKKIPLIEAPLNFEVALQSRLIDLPHQDPADRFLAATAKVYNLKLVTADSRLIAAAGIPLF